MALLEIKKDTDPVLKKQAKSIRKVDDALRLLAQDMVETMIAANGVGLAGNQVGCLKRVIIVMMDGAPQVFLNPKIVKKSREAVPDDEGCLSVPGIAATVCRHECVRIHAQNLDMNPVRLNAEGLLARIFQHEIDHLNGILILDRAEPGTIREIKLETEGEDEKINDQNN
ncbi:MAG: peptide deformylase [bacterium]